MPSPGTTETPEQVQREAILKQVLALFYAAYDKPPLDGMALKITVAAWRIALADVPTAELMPLAQAELQHRTNHFFPTPAELLKRWKGEEFVTGDDGKPERVTVANASAYRPWVPSLVPALPEGDPGPGRKAWQALGERLPKMAREERSSGTAARLTPTTEKQLGAALYDWVHMETWKRPHGEWVEFGTWLLARFPVAEWTPSLGRQQWGVWQAERALAIEQATETDFRAGLLLRGDGGGGTAGGSSRAEAEAEAVGR